jgi:hypothetical protein
MAVLEQRKRGETKFVTANNTLTSGITKSDPNLPIVRVLRHFGDEDIHSYMTYFETNSLIKAVTNANLSFGEHLLTFPLGLIEPVSASLEVTGLCTTGTANAPDVGLGSVIATGANAVISGTATFEDFMLGSTLAAGWTAATATTQVAVNKARAQTSKVLGVNVLNGSATATKMFFNIGQDSDASENFTFSVKGVVHWRWLGNGLGTGLGI